MAVSGNGGQALASCASVAQNVARSLTAALLSREPNVFEELINTILPSPPVQITIRPPEQVVLRPPSKRERFSELLQRYKLLGKVVASRADAKQMEEYNELHEKLRHSAAVVIQARVRGFQVRKPATSARGPAPGTERLDVQAFLRTSGIQANRQAAGRVLPRDGWTLEELQAEKKIFKLVLAKTHADLERKLGHPPTKKDKERFRPIYEMYNHVKTLIKQRSTTSLRIEQIRSEKRMLQKKLNEYEKTFEQLKRRKVKFQHDIEPVRDEWNRYKLLKKELEELESKGAQEAAARESADRSGTEDLDDGRNIRVQLSATFAASP